MVENTKKNTEEEEKGGMEREREKTPKCPSEVDAVCTNR